MSNGDDFQKSVLRFRAARRAVRAASILCLWRRKQVVEAVLARLFGDVAEADGHLLEIEPRDRSIGARLRRTGRWDPCEKILYERELHPGMTVVDAGANVGYFSLLFARLVGPTGRVYAFEPDPGNFNLLDRNIKRNGYGNITAVPMALSRESGRRKFSRSPHNFADHCLGDGLGKRELLEVEVVRLDDFFAGAPKQVDFLKLDIQGAEFAAIDGAKELLRANPEIVLLTEFWPDGMRRFGDDPEEYLATLGALGFSLRLVAGRSRPELRLIDHVEDLFKLCEGERAVNLFGRMI
ncbi:MAG: FkbM family methyltransferase [Candidatus Binatia bacterium]